MCETLGGNDTSATYFRILKLSLVTDPRKI